MRKLLLVLCLAAVIGIIGCQKAEASGDWGPM